MFSNWCSHIFAKTLRNAVGGVHVVFITFNYVKNKHSILKRLNLFLLPATVNRNFHHILSTYFPMVYSRPLS